jgi:AraC family transcriptional regulator, transcriptional activator of pobA
MMRSNLSQQKTIPLHHFPRHQDRDLPLRLFRIEEIARAGVDRHEFYNILWITAGTGTHYIDFQGYPIQQNAIYCMAPGQVHLWDTRSEIFGHSLIFTEDCLLPNATNPFFMEEFTLFNVIERVPSIYLSSVQATQLQPIIDLLWQEHNSLELGCATTLQSLLQVLFVHLQRYTNATYLDRSDGANLQLTDRFWQSVEQHFLTAQTVQAYADLLGITANHLSESVKTATGLPASVVIRRRSILEAKRLLVHTDRSVQQIADLLNFQDPSYFGRFFKRETGQSPIAFRRTIREKYHFYQD